MHKPNSKGVKIFGGISLGTIALAFGLYFSISDRAAESGVEKATVKKEVEAIAKRVDDLESHEKEAESILHGKDGLVATVEVIKTELKAIGKQGDALGEQNKLILQKIDELAKK